jgi:hypothetical protein
MIGAPPLLFGYLIFAALVLELCLQLGGTMTLPLHCRLVSSGDPLFWGLFLSCSSIRSSFGDLKDWHEWKLL